MKYKFFIASRWRNKDAVLSLFHDLEKRGFSVYSCMDEANSTNNIYGDPEQEMEIFESLPDWWNNPILKETFSKDIVGLQESETLILLLPAGKSAHIEAGIAFGMGKTCIVIGEQKEAESLYLIFSSHYDTIDQFYQSLK